jgi:murein L,D-transpeptidase YcbB/YkuD
MTGFVGRRLLASGAIGVFLTAFGTVYAAPENTGPATRPGSVPEPANVSPPATPNTESGIPGSVTDVKSLTGKDLVRAPLAPGLTGQDAAVAAALRELLANDLQRLIDRKADRSAIEAFYRDRGFAPLWIAGGTATPRTRAATAFLRGVDTDGLDPSDYPTPDFAQASDAAALAQDELRLTQSIVTFARHARTGRVHFTRVSGAVFYDLQAPDPAEVLTAVTAASDIGAALNAYHPQHPGYQALKAKLAEARGKSGKTSRGEAAVHIPDGPALRPGAEDMRVPMLRRRLSLRASDSWRYDDDLVAAVKAFQKKEGLRADGVLRPRAVARLNEQGTATVGSNAVDSILVNMERWRWLPRDLGPAHVVVNIPDYTLAVFDRGKQVWSTRIVVGKPGNLATPLISETMKYITVNPTWNVPPSIIRNEYLPVLRVDPGALARTGLKMGRNADGSIRIYQPPGERNALGRIRFNFPNKFLVYQHDTPNKELFAKETRAYSHGCMRVQNPDTYAEVLLAISQPGDHYSAERIRGLYGKGERTITFAQPIPVHLTYQTAFVDAAGNLEIRKDVYGHDSEILGQLRGSDRRVADMPIRRNYASSSKPVTARVRTRDDDGSRRRYVRRVPREYELSENYPYDRRYYAGPGSYGRSGGFLDFLFR